MNEILHDTSPAAIAGAVEANTCAHYANFRHLPEAEISDRPDRLRYATGVPLGFFNGMVQKQIVAERIDSDIAETLAIFQRRQHPFWWWFMPSLRQVKLRKLVVRRQCTGIWTLL